MKNIMKNNEPTAYLAINKSRIKQYDKKNEIPVYYLHKSSQFQIELFNPTTDKVLAKIKLNNKLISQSGLVLRPGERVFLDRYFDIDKKFKFDTYEVSGGDEVKQAIRDNGDVEVLFYKEQTTKLNPIFINSGNSTTWTPFSGPTWTYSDGTSSGGYAHTTTTNGVAFGNTSTTVSTNALYSSTATLDMMSQGSLSNDFAPQPQIPDAFKSTSLGQPSEKKFKSRLRSTKIETGRVEEGAVSGQKFQTVNIDFETYPFHRVSYKLLPISQKNVETQDLHKSYCTNCGAKAKAKDNFCSKCGRKL